VGLACCVMFCYLNWSRADIKIYNWCMQIGSYFTEEGKILRCKKKYSHYSISGICFGIHLNFTRLSPIITHESLVLNKIMDQQPRAVFIITKGSCIVGEHTSSFIGNSLPFHSIHLNAHLSYLYCI
jgi:hypothetical protein